MIGAEKLKVGDEVWCSDWHWNHNRECVPRSRVIKIGRKYLTLENHRRYVVKTGAEHSSCTHPPSWYWTFEWDEIWREHQSAVDFFSGYGFSIWRNGRCDSEELILKRVELWKRCAHDTD